MMSVIGSQIVDCVPAPPVCPGENAAAENIIKYYFELGYTKDEIAGFLLLSHGIVLSVHSVKRILHKLGLRRNGVQSPIEAILAKMCELHENGYRNTGYRTLWKVLNVHCGLRVTQNTVRQVLKVIDQEGVKRRAAHRLRRRSYLNKGPNYLVHIDGYDKLKPYGIAIHGSIDGFSRRLLWLKAGPSNNNPRYIARFYLDLVIGSGYFPRCIRMDAGTENSIVRDLQTALFIASRQRSTSPPILIGRSPSNQRIERFWGSLRTGFTNFWLELFKDMQDSGALDIRNILHIESLRFCFLEMIEAQLKVFMDTWNLHRIRHQPTIRLPCGIPDILYFQPEMFNCQDYSIALPCSTGRLEEVAEHMSDRYPLYGCNSAFLSILEMLTGLSRYGFRRPKTVSEGKALFDSMTNVFANIQSSY